MMHDLFCEEIAHSFRLLLSQMSIVPWSKQQCNEACILRKTKVKLSHLLQHVYTL